MFRQGATEVDSELRKPYRIHE